VIVGRFSESFFKALDFDKLGFQGLASFPGTVFVKSPEVFLDLAITLPGLFEPTELSLALGDFKKTLSLVRVEPQTKIPGIDFLTKFGDRLFIVPGLIKLLPFLLVFALKN
jgi:hypothetical protein